VVQFSGSTSNHDICKAHPKLRHVPAAIVDFAKVHKPFDSAMVANHRMNELLWSAVEAGSVEQIVAAVQQGANVNARHEGGETALTQATSIKPRS